MSIVRVDPGECPICGAAHTSCTASTGRIAVPQMPGRDAAIAVSDVLVAETVQATLPDGSFTTGTYRRDKKRT